MTRKAKIITVCAEIVGVVIIGVAAINSLTKTTPENTDFPTPPPSAAARASGEGNNYSAPTVSAFTAPSSRSSSINDAETFLHRFYDHQDTSTVTGADVKKAIRDYVTDTELTRVLSDMGEIPDNNTSGTKGQVTPKLTLRAKIERAYLHNYPNGQQNVLIYYLKRIDGKSVSSVTNYFISINLEYSKSAGHWLVSEVESNKMVNFALDAFPQGQN